MLVYYVSHFMHVLTTFVEIEGSFYNYKKYSVMQTSLPNKLSKAFALIQQYTTKQDTLRHVVSYIVRYALLRNMVLSTQTDLPSVVEAGICGNTSNQHNLKFWNNLCSQIPF